MSFHEIIEYVEELPVEEQELLIELVKKRIIEKRRRELEKEIKQARKDYEKGKVTRGTADDLIREILK